MATPPDKKALAIARQRAVVAAAQQLLNDSPELLDGFRRLADAPSEPTERRMRLTRDTNSYLRPTQWKPGQSGNPAGRPPGRVSNTVRVLRDRLSEIDPETGYTYAELVAVALVHRAINGDAEAASMICEFEGIEANQQEQ